jgi:hypothetical protein
MAMAALLAVGAADAALAQITATDAARMLRRIKWVMLFSWAAVVDPYHIVF